MKRSSSRDVLPMRKRGPYDAFARWTPPDYARRAVQRYIRYRRRQVLYGSLFAAAVLIWRRLGR